MKILIIFLVLTLVSVPAFALKYTVTLTADQEKVFDKILAQTLLPPTKAKWLQDNINTQFDIMLNRLYAIELQKRSEAEKKQFMPNVLGS